MNLYSHTSPIYSSYTSNGLYSVNGVVFPKLSQLDTPIHYTDKPTQIRLLKTSKLLKVQYL